MENVQVIVLSPQPAPRTVTATVPVRKLLDHFLAFLDANNPDGFDAEIAAQISEDAIGDLMLLAAQTDSLSVSEFKLKAKALNTLSGGTIGHARCLDLMARLFGYKNWQQAKARVRRGLLSNRRTDRDRISMKLFGIDFRK
ncbi:TPA: hypothetical protein ACYLN4_000691 [Burkholderia lata]